MRSPTPIRARLMTGASLVCLGIFGAGPATAQLAALKAASAMALHDLPANAIPAPGGNLGSVSLIRDQGSAVSRQLATQMRLANSVGLITQAQTAARGAAAALASTVPNGLTAGGLQLAANLKPAVQDAGGLNTYQGALAPTQTTSGGATTVDITQTASRAVLSWTTFNIGKDTTLNFNQKANGVVQKDWVAFNRVVGQYDPATGRRDPTLAPAPSQILGRLRCDASCIVVNANGVFFSGTAQVNAGSLLVSTLDFRVPDKTVPTHLDVSTGGQIVGMRPATIGEANDSFLRNGLVSSSQDAGGFTAAHVQTSTVSGPDTTLGIAFFENNVEGSIFVAAGAQITVGDAGYISLGAPRITNAGTLSATNGSVLLGAGRSAGPTDPLSQSPDIAGDVRGFAAGAGVASTTDPFTSFYIVNTGVVTSPRGYIGLYTAPGGVVFQNGVLQSTTSVSRNGFIDLTATDVQLSPGSTIAITPDANGETIPQSPDSVAAFKTSRVRIASAIGTGGGIEVGANSLLYAPGGRVSLGFDPSGQGGAASRVFIDTGATIDVGGIKDLQVPASRNQVTISPAKRNELRDTPNYRTSFLNGATIYVDPRRSGVRADGVAWVGSPLVEAGSFYQNIGVTSTELLTRGGQVSIGAVAPLLAGGPAGEFTIKPGATIDVSGGWVTYQAGQVQTSQLVTRGGQIVDIGNADPNGDYVGLVNPFTTVNTRFGITDKFPNGTLQGVQTVGQYSEGRDAGSLAINAPTIALDGSVYGQAYAGALQRGNAVLGTAKSTIAGDLRTMQGAPSQLPSGARLAIDPLTIPPGTTVATQEPTGDIQIISLAAIPTLATDLAYGGSVSLDATGALVRPTTRDPASLLPTTRHDTILLSDRALSGMGLGQLTLDTSGALNFAPGTVTTLAPGGVLDANVGRSIHVDGNVSAPSGRISLTTFSPKQAAIYQVGDTDGSFFRPDTPQIGSFDVVVNGTLSTRGRFVNDLAVAADAAEGSGYTSGGSVSIIAAPYVRTVVGAPVNEATDISGSILINPGALVDVSSGASVGATGVVGTGARGGNLSLSQETTYAQLLRLNSFSFLEFTGIRVNIPASGLTGDNTGLAINPGAITAKISIAPGTVRGHGFIGGGAFTLTTPDFNFGNSNVATGTQLPLDFFQQSGFSAYTINVLKTNLSPNRFTNGLGGYNAVLQTDAITLGAGQDLLLTQSQFSPLLTTDQVLAFQALSTGGSLYSVLAPSVPVAAFDARPIALKFGGLVELEVASGARVDGAAGASLTVGKLLDEGVIHLPGGSVIASETIPGIYDPTTSSRGSISVQGPIFVNDLSQVFSTNADGSIDENSASVFGALLSGPKLDGTNGIFSNRDVAFFNGIALLGKLGPAEGIKVMPGGVIDVSGISLINPRAVAPNGLPIVDGRLIEGGTIASLGRTSVVSYFTQIKSLVRTAESIDALPGSTLDLSGASASYDRLNAAGMYVSTPQWSNGGTLLLEGGGSANGTLLFNAGSVSGATIRAAGGAPAATGGTLIVLDPILAQTDDPARANNVIAADAVQAAGFSTFVSEGTLTTTGPVNLTLNRAFFAQSRPFGGDVVTNDSPLFNVQIGAIGALNVTAPLIRFAGIAQSVPINVLGTPGTGTATFTASALDVQGAVIFDQSLSSVTLAATQDLRLIGVQPLNTTLNIATTLPSLNGQLLASGDLTLSAAQVYPTTGSSFTVASSGPNSTIRIASPGGAAPATPYSAGTNLTLQAFNIEQAGVLRAPLGTLTLGSNAPLAITSPTSGLTETLAPATTSLHLAKGSITSVSADGLSIPYGITTDQVEYFFTPTVAAQLPAPPAALLTLNGGNVALDAGATVNLKGGGDVFAFEFVPGVGGSRDVLDRFNTDAFSSRNGFQYPDARQVYAIVPGLNQANLALIDPIYAADYGALSSASQVGRQVYLDASPGLAAGYYTLLPAHYALLPGGLRVVEQPEYGTPVPGRSTQLRDGTTVVDGYYATANTGLHDSALRTFTVQTQATFKNASLIATTSADTVFPARAARNGLTSPRIPLDAGRLIIDAITGITADATFQTAAASGGRASATDIAGNNFLIVGTAPTTAPVPGTIVVTTGTLAALNSASLLIGGTRTDNADGTTSLVVSTNSITIANDSTTPLTAPELLFAVAGAGSSITLSDGSSVAASGAIGDMRTGNYLLDGASGAGALLRLSTGPERVARRTNVTAGLVPPPLLSVGLAHLAATSLLLDSSGDLNIASPATGAADIAAKQIAIGAGAVAFAGTAQPAGLSITPQLQTAFAKAATLTIRSPQAVSFAAGNYNFGALTLDAPALALLGDPGAVTLTTGALRLQNSALQLATCAPDCGTGTLGVTASTIGFGSGQIRTAGFGGGITLTAPGGVTFDGANSTYSAIQNDGSTLTNGAAGLEVGNAPLTIATPFLGDRALPLMPGQSAVLPSLALATTGALTLTSISGAIVPTVAGTPGARIALSGDTVSITDTKVVATAGALDVRAANGIALAGTASLSTPGYSKVFGDVADPTMVSAPGGLLTLTATNGAIDLGANTRLSVGGAQGQAGELRIVAANGAVDANGVLAAAAPDGGGLFTLVTRGGFDLVKFATGAAGGFDQRIDIRTGTGDLALAAGQSLLSRIVRLTADGGADSIAGTIDTSGVNGGQIALYGENGVTLAPTGKLLARASGYGATDSRQAKGGDVMIGTDGSGAITLAAGSTIDLSATRPGDRLVTDVRNGITYYRVAASDVGGTLAIRAPIVGAAGANTINVSAAGTVTGARDVLVEAFQRFDLGAIAADPAFIGVTVANGIATLDLRQTAPGSLNFLGDTGAGTIPTFVQTFDISAAAPNLKGLGAYRADPGIELDYSGNIVLASNWNLGAGTVDLAGAAAAGLAVVDPANGLYSIVPGKESAVFSRFTTLTYRVGGKVDGEPGVLTIRAGGDLTIGTNTTCTDGGSCDGALGLGGAASITDGFFAFRDQTTPEAISLAYGGGQRSFNPTLQPYCLGGCAAVALFTLNAVDQFATNSVLIDFAGVTGPAGSLIGQTSLPAAIPYNLDANSPSAGTNSGDPLGTAEVFPRLADGRAVRSFSYTLVGGADLAVTGRPSVDPTAVNAASTGKVVVRGESSYAVTPNPNGAEPGIFSKQLLINNSLSGTPFIAAIAPSMFAADFSNSEFQSNVNGVTADTASTIITLQGPNDVATSYLTGQAQKFFAGYSNTSYSSSVLGIDGITPITSVTTTLALAGQFLNQISASYGQLIANQATGDAPPVSTPTVRVAQPYNFVRTRVRTGTGGISIAAAGNIDTTNGPSILRQSGQSSFLQVGGTAVYTAGVRADLSARRLPDSSGNARTIDTSAYSQVPSNFNDPTQTPLLDALIADPLYLDQGGSVDLKAGGDVLGLRDGVGASRALDQHGSRIFVGPTDTPFRIGQVSQITDIRANPQLFQSGIATLGGGNISVVAGRDVVDLTITANTSVITADVKGGGVDPTLALVTKGGGNIAVNASRDILGGLYDVGEGLLKARAGRDVTSTIAQAPVLAAQFGLSNNISNTLRVRLADANASIQASGRIALHDIAAFGASSSSILGEPNALAFYTPIAGFAAKSNGSFTLESYGNELQAAVSGGFTPVVLPGSLSVVSLTGNLNLAPSDAPSFLFLSPSPVGQLQLFAGGNLRPVTIDMDDGDPGLLPGYLTAFATDPVRTTASTQLIYFPTVLSSTSDTTRRSYHNAFGATHAGDAEPARIAVGGDIQNLILNTPKQTRVSAGRDILDSAVFAQNLSASDITRVVAGRDIIATSAIGQAYGINPTTGVFGPIGSALPYAQGNTFVIGGPGQFYLEAGRDAGPFLTSVQATFFGGLSVQQTLGGGVLSVGSEWNPYLAPVGANVTVQFGVGKGVNYSGFRDIYLDPANVMNLPDDQFAQTVDKYGRSNAIRSEPIYAPLLLAYVQTHAAAELLAAYGTTEVTVAQAYSVFKALSPLRQRELVQQVYFNELTQTSIPTSVSYLKYSRGYRAVNLLFPPALGYTANDLSGGGSTGTVPVETGNLDLRLATIQTSRGGNIDILGPGGRVLGGSTVRTSAQAARRLTGAESVYSGVASSLLALSSGIASITSIPTGYEGFLTLRGGTFHGFVDRDFLLNQSRAFTQAGGDIALWSSNGDLNAGQGPKTSANFPPVVVRVGPNGNSEVDAVGGVTGAGIAAFQPAPGTPAPDVYLIAPRGTVDAGDAGVRVAGNLFVAALAVANADNFAVGGKAFGIPSGPVVNVAATSAAGAQSAAAAHAAQATANDASRRNIDPLSRIVVDVLGYYGSADPCDQLPRPRDCPARRK